MRLTREKQSIVFELWIFLNIKDSKNKGKEIFSIIENPSLFKGSEEQFESFRRINNLYFLIHEEYSTAKDKKKFFSMYGINSVNGNRIKNR